MSSIPEQLSYKPVELSFGTSGLRGLVSDMTDLECYINVTGFIHFLKEKCGVSTGSTIAIGGDLRDSTPRIIGAVLKAVYDEGLEVSYQGLLPTPTLAYYALEHSMPCIMVTGSHIPAERNGIKFYKPDGEVLKSDENAIRKAVRKTRNTVYSSSVINFDSLGQLVDPVPTPSFSDDAKSIFMQRFVSVFSRDSFQGKHVVVYQHSAVGRDMLVTLLEQLGAKVTSVGRSSTFIPIDTENVTPADQKYFKEIAKQHPDAFAIVSTDGDSDRPFVVDENGLFHRGDVLGAIVAQELRADFATVPVSASDAVDTWLEHSGIPLVHTAIGSPHVIVAMQKALTQKRQHIVGWEVNGGLLTGSNINFGNGVIKILPTRDAFLPILIALLSAVKQSLLVSELFATLPKRFTQAGLLDNFPSNSSAAIIAALSKQDGTAEKLIETCFGTSFGTVSAINLQDGVRITFSSGDIAHIRPSGNAPQLRIYSVADTQKRADKIVALGIEDNGILQRLVQSLT